MFKKKSVHLWTAEPRPILTSPVDTVDIVYYDPEDLLLGQIISVHGRR